MGGRCSGVDEKSPTGYGYSLKGKCNKETSLKKCQEQISKNYSKQVHKIGRAHV